MDGASLSVSHDVLVFQLDGETCALKTMDIQEIIRFEPITPIPRAPSYVAGIINFRGSLLTILDPAKRLFRKSGSNEHNPGYILIPLVESWPVGLMVSNVEGIVSAENIKVTEALKDPQSLKNIDNQFCEGIVNWTVDETERTAILLDLGKLAKPGVIS